MLEWSEMQKIRVAHHCDVVAVVMLSAVCRVLCYFSRILELVCIFEVIQNNIGLISIVYRFDRLNARYSHIYEYVL